MGMKVWIVTIGNSDVQLKSGYKKSLWNNHHAKFEKEYKHTFEPVRETPKDPATVPARVMGIVYGTNLDTQIFQELHFPLLDRFTEYLQGTNCPDKIIVILTDQENVFGKGDKNKKECPYWQDTRTLKPILEKYFEQDNKYPQLKTGEHIHYLPLEAEPEKEGLDDWNECLRLVDQLFQTEQITYIDKDANIFVSHQAGTPAISSAVQFTSLAKFEKQVQFLVSNEYKDRQAIPIPSSKYLRGIQIQKAKQLIVDGFPGAALKLLEDTTEIDTNVKLKLNRLVGVLNIENTLAKGNEFDVQPAIYRVIDALEIVEIFFEKQNYIQGITLLAAAHETFMKAALVKKIHKDNNIKWSEPGLGFVGNLDRKAKIEILRKLKFPVDDARFNNNLNKEDINSINSINRVIGSNEGMFEWLCKLYDPLFKSTSWKLLQYICKYRRSYGTDRRNQLMHNLVGAKPKEVIKYLLGDQQDTSPYTDDNAGVVNAYKEQVKKPFLEQIKKLGLPYKESDLRKQLEEIASKLR
ncbi:hypothetical protein [Dolichospermum sp. LEGE 00240]|uniref:hypothetical protein n=1 Tax=Dolichospermum sp. LEGE 00240 TaxID=1828603 RepID=UPI001D1367E2|nr:hypothetical protein [Dolichospermum sp. LEGE 00240]